DCNLRSVLQCAAVDLTDGSGGNWRIIKFAEQSSRRSTEFRPKNLLNGCRSHRRHGIQQRQQLVAVFPREQIDLEREPLGEFNEGTTEIFKRFSKQLGL